MMPDKCPHCHALIADASSPICNKCGRSLHLPVVPPPLDIDISVKKAQKGATITGAILNMLYDDRAAREAQRQLAQHNRQVLLDRVHTTYIEGKLGQQEETFNHFAADKGLIPLNKRFAPEALDPSATTLDDWAYLSRPELLRVPPEKSIADIFGECAHALLILGEPGTGKTVALLELGRTAVERAKDQVEHPVPVVLELDTWQIKQLSLVEWIVAEMRTSKYGVHPQASRAWIENGELMLLLDGLDQVLPAHRQSCSKAINDFLDKYGGNWIAVTCRCEEYARLPVRLKLHGAIRLEPLTSSQLEDYFACAGPQLEGLSKAGRDDPHLQKMLETPLMLAVTSLAYEDITQPEWWGGVFIVQHVTLRVMLWLTGYTPRLRRFDTILDDCAQITFLRKIGGGYQFFHRYIQDYFASLHHFAGGKH